jgi:hypothetical protein
VLSEALGKPCRRNLNECRDGNSGDIVLPASVPFCVQAKIGQNPPTWRALAEARAAAECHQEPVAILRRNGRGSTPATDVAVIPLAVFAGMLRALYGKRTDG